MPKHDCDTFQPVQVAELDRRTIAAFSAGWSL